MQLPGLEALYDDFKEKGIDEIYCLSVNDSFVMNAWAEKHEIENVKMIPDGSGEFTRDMDMLVWKPAQNFGYRSWRYAMVVNGMEVEKMGDSYYFKVNLKIEEEPGDTIEGLFREYWTYALVITLGFIYFALKR